MFKQLSTAPVLAIALALALCACSNSEYVDEFGVPVSMYLPDEDTEAELPEQGSTSKPDTLTEFPPSGFFAKPFTISLPGSMKCETGGFAPTKKSPSIKVLHIDSSTTIRCAELLEDSSQNAETIHTYLFEKKPTIPAIFITTDPNSLFDPDTGIYMEGPNAKKAPPHRGANYWLNKEIPVFIEMTESGSSVPEFSKHSGLKIFGNWSRMNAKKSVVITFRETYGEKKLNHAIFPEFPKLTKFKSIVLRNFGNSFGVDYIRDRLAGSISEGLGVDYQRGRFVLVYYNSKYFGIHDMRERSDEHYFETHYGIDHEKINLLNASNNASAGTPDDYIALMDWIGKNSLANDDNYAYVASKIDIDNFINYMQVELFTNNRDWPGNNLKKWNRSDKKTRWKWFLYDLDLSFGNEIGDPTSNIFGYAASTKGETKANAPKHTLLFRSLLKNKQFKEAFINRQTTLLQTNFESSRILASIEKMMSEIESEIPRDQKRWSVSKSLMNDQLKIIKTFAQERQSIILKQLQEYFKLGETSPVTLSTAGPGRILVHGLPINKPSITVNFFVDLPVTISAETQAGGVWQNWSDGETSVTRTILPSENKNLTAKFK